MTDSDDLFKFYYSQHDKYSIRTSWHQQHLIENILDLQGFVSSISESLEDERLEEPITSFPLGYFQIEQPSRIRYAHIVFLFTVLERRVRALLKLTVELKPTIVKDISDYKGSFLEKTKQFLKDNLGIDLSTSSVWPDIMVYQKVRDCIIHCDGNVNESRDVIILKQLAHNSKLSLNNNGYILVDNAFCEEMESSIIQFVVNGLETLYNVLVELEVKKNDNV